MNIFRLATFFFFLLVVSIVSANAADPTPKKFAGNSPEAVEPLEDGLIILPASKCEVYGTTLEYMPEDEALGYWNSSDDHAKWSIKGAKAGVYEVWFEWSCAKDAAGNTFVLEGGKEKLTGRIPTTGSWQKHENAKFGTVEIVADNTQLSLRAEGEIKVALGDFRAIRLKPVTKKASP